MSQLNKLTGAEKRYPVPPNGKILQSEHLRDLTLFALATSAKKRFGEWGLIRPLDCNNKDQNAEANRVTFEGKELVIRNVALICREGIIIRTEEARARFSSGGGEIYLAWTMPEDSGGGVGSDGGITVELCVGTRPEGTVTVMLGRMLPADSARATVPRDRICLDVPALGLDASSELDAAWSALGGALAGLAKAVKNSTQGSCFERLEVWESLRSIMDMPRHLDPARATWELRAITRRLENFVRAYRGEQHNAAEHEAAALSRAADECLDGAGAGIDPLIKLIQKATSTETAEIERWLRPSTELRLRPQGAPGFLHKQMGTLIEPSGTVEFEFSGEERAETSAPQVSWRIDGKWRELEPLEFDPKRPGVAVTAIPDGAVEFEIRCDHQLKVKATQYPKTKSEPADRLQAIGDAR